MSVVPEGEILTLLLEYARALDDKNWEGFAALFVAEGELVLPWGDPVPRSSIAQDTETKLGRFAATQHVVSNRQVELAGAAIASSRSYVQAVHVHGDGQVWTLGARYENEYRLVDGIWGFSRVQLIPMWEQGPVPTFD